MVERQGVEVVASRIDNHISSCEGFRKVVISVILGVATLIVAPLGFLMSEVYGIKGRQDVVLARLVSIDTTFASLREETGNRFTAVTTANSQREATFNERFAQIIRELNELQKEFYEYRLKERGIDYEPSSGPQRRR